MSFLISILDEVKLAFRLTVEPMRAGKRSDPGWARDRHLRNGFFLALPFILVPAIVLIPRSKNIFQFYPWIIVGSLVGNLVWFAYAAWSRKRAGESAAP